MLPPFPAPLVTTRSPNHPIPRRRARAQKVAAAFNTKRRWALSLSSSRARPPAGARWPPSCCSCKIGDDGDPEHARSDRPRPTEPRRGLWPSAACSRQSSESPAVGGGAGSAPLHLPAAMATSRALLCIRPLRLHAPFVGPGLDLDGLSHPNPLFFTLPRLKIAARGKAGR